MPSGIQPSTPQKTIPVSVFILAYNQEKTIHQAIQGIVDQSYPIDQFIVSDDCSTDSTWEQINQFFSNDNQLKGNIKDIVLRRNDTNMGLIAHNNLVTSLVRNEIFIGHAGDDISRPDRILKSIGFYVQIGQPKYFLMHTQVRAIDLPNQPILIPPVIQQNMEIQHIALSLALHFGATSVCSQYLWEKFGNISIENTYEDLILGFRAALSRSYYYIPEPLLDYRALGGISDHSRFAAEPDGGALTYYKHRIATYKQRLLDAKAVGRTDMVNLLQETLDKYLLLPEEFDPVEYLNLNHDVKMAKFNPIDHYIHFGIKEQRLYK